MIELHIEIQGYEELHRQLGLMTGELRDTLRAAGQEFAEVILDEEGIRKYPPQIVGMAQPFVSDKQRRWFFAALRNGEIEVPYRRGQSARSERYGTKWKTRNAGSITYVGNSASYAPWLAGEGQASFMAKRGWRKLSEVAKEKTPEGVKIFDGWIKRLIKRLNLD